MNKYLYFMAVLAAVFSFNSCKSSDEYTLTGRCVEWKMPEDGIVYLSGLDFSKDENENVIEQTRVGTDGSFKFSGRVKEPQIVLVYSVNAEKNYTYHGMCVLEKGDIEMDCESYEMQRGFVDCVGRGTPTNDRLRNFYSAQDSILRECVAGDGGTAFVCPEADSHLKEYMNRNINDFSSVFLAIGALYSGSSPEEIPGEIVNNKYVKAYIDSFCGTNDCSSIIIDEEIIPINTD